MSWWGGLTNSIIRRTNQNAEQTLNVPGLFPSSDLEASQLSRETISTYVKVLLVQPASAIFLLLLELIKQYLRMLYFFEPRDHLSSRNGTSFNNALINDPIRRVEQFVQQLEENLLPLQQFAQYHSDSNTLNLPPFFQGSYTQALYMATHRAKFLFIYLTNNENEEASSLFLKIITNPKFISIFTTSPDQNIIWGGDLANPEAYQLANSLNITKFPALGLICLARSTVMTPDGPVKSAPRISLISKIQGGLRDDQSPESIISNKFIKRMMKYEKDLAAIRTSLREKYISESMRRKQDMDFQRALARDRQKKLEKEQKLLFIKYLEWRKPYFLDLLQNTDPTDKAKIAIKLSQGPRMTALFPKDSPVRDIFVLVELKKRGMLDDASTGSQIVDQGQNIFDDVIMDFDFKLTSTVPPKLILNDEDPKTKIESLDYIYPSGLLMMEAK